MFGVIAIVNSTGSAAMERSTAYLQATATAIAIAYTAIVISTGSVDTERSNILLEAIVIVTAYTAIMISSGSVDANKSIVFCKLLMMLLANLNFVRFSTAHTRVRDEGRLSE